MNPFISGLFVSLACGVHSRMTPLSGATSSARGPSEISAADWNAGAVSKIKWAQGIKKMYKDMGEGQTLRLIYNEEKRSLSPDRQEFEGRIRKILDDHEIQQLMETSEDFEETSTMAPSQQSMSRTEDIADEPMKEGPKHNSQRCRFCPQTRRRLWVLWTNEFDEKHPD
ncbi:uncharacterized protein MELLADRAFT_101841 [Melampsora larici-populina 98AG31]|uniref:Secreted protein n=1 Tax=Melampsora larici-populina (strain 98AG31 / pathotype 3-4-7) TaxID=747676 RepID=F4R529_MELLP|nr:uncharacterized protein MELLADRAFT_101841 [Melampsora larici-populina 98AG31]EGG12345.1 secreted protein [Melampsora larici-populina 98AG31]